MPYSGPNDKSLPDNVKSLPDNLRSMWVGTFNSVFKNCTSASTPGGAGDAKTCEGRAMQFANGIVAKKRKELDMEEGDKSGRMISSANQQQIMAAMKTLVQLMKKAGMDMSSMMEEEYEGKKCGTDAPDVMVERPYGGAKTFSEIDTYKSAMSQQNKIEDQTDQFRIIIGNIMHDHETDVEEKANLITAAAQALPSRVKNPPEYKSLEEEDQQSLFGKFVGWLRGEKREFSTEEREKMAKQRQAMDDGSFPIANSQDLKNAIQAHGRAKDPEAVKRHIMKRAHEMDMDDMLPEEWQSKKKEDTKEGKPLGWFSAFKDKNGAWRWVGIVTNRYQDKVKELFPEEAHKEFVSYVDRTKDYPELWAWHTPGMPLGQADFVEYIDGFRIDSGYFHKDMEDVAESLSKSDGLGMSHGFKYRLTDKKEDGTFERYRSFEDTVLPAARACNPWTLFLTVEAVKEETRMPFTNVKRAFLVEHLGEDRVKKLEEELPALSKELVEAGVGFKDLEEVFQASEETPRGDPEVGDGELDGRVSALETSIQQILDGQAALQKALTESVGTLGGAVKELQKTDDEKIAGRMSPRTVVSQKGPSETGDVVDEKTVKDILGDQTPEDKNKFVAPMLAQLLGREV